MGEAGEVRSRFIADKDSTVLSISYAMRAAFTLDLDN
jgi:hypothetical protein